MPADPSGTYEHVRTFTREVTGTLGGRVDVLVDDAGTYPFSVTEALPDADLDAMLATDLRAPHVLVAELAPVSWVGRVGGLVVPRLRDL